MLKAGFIGAGGRAQGAHYPSVNRLEDDVEMFATNDSPSYEGALTMHRHFVDCVINEEVPLTDVHDVIHSMHLVDQIEGILPD